jgi:hypothetical protein
MVACIFQEVMVNTVDLKDHKGRRLRPAFLPKLFIADIPDDVTADEVKGTLFHVGPHLLGTTVDWSAHRIELEASWPEEVALTWNQGHFEGRKVSWKVLEGDERRITIRLALRLFAEVEAEARTRKQSLNEFCLDALAAQLRTRSKRIERVLLEHSLRGPDDSGTPTTLGLLFNFAMNGVADCSHTDLVEGLKRLAGRGYLTICKYDDSSGAFEKYVPDKTADDFFYRGELRLKLSGEGRPYLEGLRAALVSYGKGQLTDNK